MGFPHYNLVPVVLLRRNPGVTRDEFVELLEGISVSSVFTKGSGLEGLARLLGLQMSLDYRQFCEDLAIRYGVREDDATPEMHEAFKKAMDEYYIDKRFDFSLETGMLIPPGRKKYAGYSRMVSISWMKKG